MAGLFSADAWEKVWTFRGTFFLGVEHTLMTAVCALFISLLLGIAFGLMSTGRNKALDPIADKLTHGALALCLAFRYPQMWVLFGLMVLKEGYMVVMGLLFLRKGKMLNLKIS